MKSLSIVLVSLAIVCSISMVHSLSLREGLVNNILPLHNDHVLQLAREFIADISFNHTAFTHFKKSLETVRAHNLKTNSTYTLDIASPFAFMSDEEFFQKFKGIVGCDAVVETTQKPRNIKNFLGVPSSKNWTALNKVSAVKDQQNCGSCWAFAATGAVESHYAIYEDVEALSLSEQQLMDCSTAFNNHGCDGGLPSQGFEYIVQAGGLAFENSYFYEPQQSECQFEDSTIGARLSGSVNISQGDEVQMKSVVGTIGPVATALQVLSDFKLYSSGIYSNPNCDNSPQAVSHAVLAVGYGHENGINFWYVKNSWSEYWGEEGYFKIEMGSNMCGIATCASYPIIKQNPENDNETKTSAEY